LKFGRYGEFLACSGYPGCRYTRDLGKLAEEAAVEVELPTCPECSAPMVQRRSRFGLFFACSRYPECRGTRRLGAGPAAQDPPKETGVPCPASGCDGVIVQRRSRRGKVFYGCSRYPKCEFSMWDPPLLRPCSACNHPVTGLKETRSRGRELVCPVKACGHREPAPEDLELPVTVAVGEQAPHGDEMVG
jgi:DNA topoisomerase-1